MAEAEYDERNDPNSPNYAPDEDLPPPEEDPQFDDFGKPKKPRKRRKWPWVVLVLLLLLGLLVLFLPTIANAPPVRAFVLEKINNQLNGTLEVTEWSVGWTGNTEITGVRITQNGAQVLAARRLFTELSLLDIVKGNWDLGTTIVEDLTFVFKQFPDGTNNFQKLPKQPSSGEPIILPDLRGDVDVTFWGSITQADGTLITLDKSRLNAKFDSINGPIAHDLDVTARIAGKDPGKLTAKGLVDLFEAGRVDTKQLTVDESLDLGGFTLDAIAGLMPPDGPITTLKGLTSGKLQLKLQGTNEIFVQGDITSEDFALGGPALGGDTLRDKLVTITIPETRYDRASGRLRTRQTGSQPQQIVVKMKQLGSIAIGANAPLPGITNALGSKAPGTDGRIVLNADLNVEAANQLPNLLPLPQGMRITSGSLRADAELLLENKAAHVKGQVNLTELGGIDRNRREVYAEPIQLTYNATSLGGGGAIPNLRDLRLSLSSGFANVQGQGESLSKVSVNGNADLAKFRDQIGQFVELGLKQLAGQVVFNVASNGDLANAGGKSNVTATVTATNVVYQPMDGEAIKEPWARLTAKGELLRGEEQFVEEINNAAISAQTGNEQKPTVDAHLNGDLAFVASASPGKTASTFITAPRLESRMSIDLAAAQREFGALLNPLRERGLTFTQGLVIASGAGSYDGATLKLAGVNAVTQDVSLHRLLPNRDPATILSDYSATIDLAGAFRNDAAGLEARVSTLNVTDASKILTIAEAGDGDLVVQMTSNGTRRIDGKVRLAADLKALNDIFRNLGDYPLEAVAETKAGQLRQGELSGTLAFTPAEQKHTLLTGDLAVNRLSVTTNGKPIENEQVTLALRVRADDTFSNVAAQQVNLKSSFLTANVKDTDLRLAGPTPDAYVSPLDVVQRGAVTWNVPDLPRTVNIARAFMAGPTQESEDDDPPAADDPTAARPLEVRSGTLNGSLRLDRNNEGITVTLDQLAGQRIVLNRGKGQFGPEDINLKLTALVRTNPPSPTTRPVAEDIQEIRINQLGGDIAVANVALEEPIVIRDPGGMTQASGAIKIDGQVRTLSDLLRTLEYLSSDNTEKFDGAYTVTQRLTTQQQTIGLSGQVNIQNFVAGNFREKLVRLANDLQLDQSKKALNIRNFALNLEESKALSVKATGTIADYNTDRRFRNTRALVSYDAAKLPDLIRPLLDPATQEHIKTLKLSGVIRDEPFIIEGRYPATQPATDDPRQRDPIQYVTAHGRLAFEAFEYEGLPGKNLVVPVMLDNGRLSTVYPQKDRQYPAPATFSRGRLDVGGLQVHLAANAIRFSSMRQNHKVLDRVIVNRAIIERYLGQAHPLFTGADEARGVVTLTVNELDRLPIGERLKRPGRKEEGKAKFTLALTDLRLKTFFLAQVLGTLKVVQVEPDGTVRTSIPDASFVIERGVVNSNLGLNLGGTVLGFRDGSVRLRDNQIVSLNMQIPKALIPALRDEPAIKEFISVPVTGSLTRPQFDIVKSAIQSSGITNPLDLLKRLQGDQGTGGATGSDRIGGSGTTPETPPKEQPRNQPRNQPRGRQRR